MQASHANAFVANVLVGNKDLYEDIKEALDQKAVDICGYSDEALLTYFNAVDNNQLFSMALTQPQAFIQKLRRFRNDELDPDTCKDDKITLCSHMTYKFLNMWREKGSQPQDEVSLISRDEYKKFLLRELAAVKASEEQA